ncbi:MAG: nucleoside kinase, partial [Bacteroidales bacterium]|nr:nucleoside kinase [Bacteroidales bacterium]
MIEIICTNNNQKKEYPIGTNLLQIAEDQQIQLTYPVIAAKVNNEVKSLKYEIYKNKQVTFIDISDVSGFLIYAR